MIRPQFMLCFACLAAQFLLTASSRSIEPTNTFYGRVVDLGGHPVAGISLIILPTKLINGHAISVIDKFPTHVTKSDDAGQFSITNVKPGPVQLEVISPTEQSQQRYELVSIKIGAATFYPMVPTHGKGLKFAIETGADREDVVVTVRPRTRYKGQVVFEDGAPLNERNRPTQRGMGVQTWREHCRYDAIRLSNAHGRSRLLCAVCR